MLGGRVCGDLQGPLQVGTEHWWKEPNIVTKSANIVHIIGDRTYYDHHHNLQSDLMVTRRNFDCLRLYGGGVAVVVPCPKSCECVPFSHLSDGKFAIFSCKKLLNFNQQMEWNWC